MSLAVTIALALASCHGTDAQFSIGGNVSGTNGPVVVRLNGANDINMNGDGDFTFSTKLLQNDTFNVQIANPTGRCTVQNGAGTVAQANVNDVNISCASYATSPAGLLQIVVRSSNLSGAHVNPAVTTSATAVGGVIVDPTDTDASGNVRIVGGLVLSGFANPPTDVSIFEAPKGNAGGNGPAIIPLILAADGVTAVLPPDAALDTNALAALFAGELYFNVSTLAHASGEIRGAIELQGGMGASAPSVDESQVLPMRTNSTAFGAGVLMVDRATSKIVISYIQHTVVGALGAGINTGSGAGTQVLGFGNLQNSFDGHGTNLATPTAGSVLPSLADFDNNLLFFNVTSTTFPGGEIRGNISPLPQ